MKSFSLIFAALFITTQAFTQSANYKQADRFIMTRMGSVLFSRDISPYFIGNTDQFWYTYKTSKGKEYYHVNPKNGKQSLLFDRRSLAAQISKLSGAKCNPEDFSIAVIFAPDGKSFRFNFNGTNLEYTLSTGKCQLVPSPKTAASSRAQTPRQDRRAMMNLWSRDSSCYVFTKNHDIWMGFPGQPDSLAVRLTTDGVESFSYSDNDQGNNREPFTTKAQWITGTHRLFVLREDNRGTGSLYVINALNGRPTPVNSSFFGARYIMGGDKVVPQYELSLIDADTREVKKVALDKWKDQKVKHLYTSKDHRYVYYQRTRRTCDELDICRVDTRSGELTVILNEVCKPCFNDRHQSITFLNNDREFLWWSERGGWGHYYLYAADGTLKNAVTSGDWMANSIVRLDTLRRELIFTGHGREAGHNPYYSHLYKARLDGKGTPLLLTPENANHNVTLTPSGRYLIDTYSRVDMAPVSVLRDLNGKLLCRLAETDLSPLYATGWKMPEPITVKAADGVTDLYGTMWKPYDFDSTRRYPIISYVYPGPSHEALDLNFTITGNHNAALAQVGFIVINIGHRGGSPLRGHAYRTFGYGNIRDFALADDKAAIEQLAARHSYIDAERVGIFGHSAGGLMAAAAICTYPDFYKAAIAASGNHDNRIYNQTWVETFQGVEEGKDKNGNITFTTKIPTNMELAKNLKGHLLLVTGDSDDNVHPAHTLRLADALIKAGKQFDMYVLPGQNHLYKKEADMFYRRKIWFYFGKHLLGDNSSDNFSGMEDFNQQ